MEKRVSEPIRHHVPVLVRGFIEHRNGQWQGFSLEYGLAVQGTSLNDVKRRLEKQIASYLFDALVGEDREHAEALLSRRATASVYFRYFMYKAMGRFRSDHDGSREHRAFRTPLALEPRLCSP
jgi:hypothetical protein